MSVSCPFLFAPRAGRAGKIPRDGRPRVEGGERTLPDSREGPVALLAQMLNDTTNSYKYLFLLSLLDAVQVLVTNPDQFDCTIGGRR